MSTATTSGPGLRVLRAGPLTTIQDLGRGGWAHLGVPESGAADRASLRLANRLVGNRESAAGLEVTVGGLVVQAERDLLVAVAGASVPMTITGGSGPAEWTGSAGSEGGSPGSAAQAGSVGAASAGSARPTPVPGRSLLRLRAGQKLAMAPAVAGVRAYLAVRGGIDVPPVLGSRSGDVLCGLGPAVLRDGDELPVGTDTDGWPVTDLVPGLPPPTGPVTLWAIAGPHEHRLAPAGRAALDATIWQVDERSDRVGLRLSGPALEVTAEAAAPSEPMVRGAIQVPPGGRPVVFLADHPVTGGYPVIAVLPLAEVDRAAQLRPGQPVRLALRPAPEFG